MKEEGGRMKYFLLPLSSFPPQDQLHRFPIPLVKQMQMVEQVVEVVHLEPLAVPWRQRAHLFVGRKESARGAAEQREHGQIGLGPAVMRRRVDQAGNATRTWYHVAAPQVPMQQAGRLRGDQLRQPRSEALQAGN